MRTRIKICGITRVEDALAAANLGADAIGLVFYAPSPRCVSIDNAREIVAALPPFVTTVGLFVNATQAIINQVLSTVKLDCLQFHGDETEADCMRYNLPYLKAIRVRPETNLIQYALSYKTAKALLLDTYSATAVGGTGQVFDWRMVPEHMPKPIVLAGGLNADNVAQAIAQVKPFAVDVSGGVESAKGIKDNYKMAAFIAAVQQNRSE